MELPTLRRQEFDARMAAQGHDLELVWMARHDIQRTDADRAGGAEYRQLHPRA
jgi:hypothetical protein